MADEMGIQSESLSCAPTVIVLENPFDLWTYSGLFKCALLVLVDERCVLRDMVHVGLAQRALVFNRATQTPVSHVNASVFELLPTWHCALRVAKALSAFGLCCDKE